MKAKLMKSIVGLSIVVIVTIFNLSHNSKQAEIMLGLDEIEALACRENGCTKNFSRVEAEEFVDGSGVMVSCSGCGSLTCKAPR